MNNNVSLPPISDIFHTKTAPELPPSYQTPLYPPRYYQLQMANPVAAPRIYECRPSSYNLLNTGAVASTPAMYHKRYDGAYDLMGPYSRPLVGRSLFAEAKSPEATKQQVPPTLNSGKVRTRNNLPKGTTQILLKWLNEHLNHPYPNSFEKTQLIISTGLNQQQLSNWFINARRRKIKALRQKQKLPYGSA